MSYDEASLRYLEHRCPTIDGKLYVELKAISELAARALHANPGNEALREIEARLGTVIGMVVPI